MGTRRASKSGTKKGKKLALNKKTLRDLTPGKGKADAMLGGRRGNCSGTLSGC
jgi:hypothetical protein